MTYLGDEGVARARMRVLERKANPRSADAIAAATALRRTAGETSWQRRRGAVSAAILTATRFEAPEGEPLMGRLRAVSSDPRLLQDAVDYLKDYPMPPGQTGHCELDLSRLFALGMDGIMADIETRRAAAVDPDARAAYGSFADALRGMSRMIENAASEAESGGDSALAALCRRIAHHPPRTFHEAIQLLWFTILAVMNGDTVGLVVPGHLDRTLAPFHMRDRQAGVLTRDKALELIETLYLLVNDYIPDGLAMSVMVGGRDAEGHDVTNELSYLCLEALRRTRMIYPTVGVCWHERTPESLVDLAIELIADGLPTPAFFSDDTIQKGMRDLGAPPEDACDYINSTCVEITPVGASGVWVASPYINLCALLLEEIAAQTQSTEPAPDFDAFLAALRPRLAAAITAGANEQNHCRRIRREKGRKPLQSVFTRDCIGRGCDIDDGGAIYNWVECSFVGLANLADSLIAMRDEIYGRGTPWNELKAALDANFEAHETLHARLTHQSPKYGQDTGAPEALVGELAGMLREECAKQRMEPDGAPFVPGAFVWQMHEYLGRETGATPDGRRAGFPFADGCGPAQGRETQGPTAAILATTSWEHSPMLGGLAYNIKFNRRFFDDANGRVTLKGLSLAFLRRGGFEMQVNVTCADTLRRAREHPDQYRDLIVRIGGYADYFTRLSHEMQDEIIMRTEFNK